jgi:P27 family predicted phage terminase small subunit
MGKRGPRPLPSAIKMLRGTDQPCRMNPDEPAPARGVPTMPPELDQTQRREWERLVSRCDAIGVLTVADGPMLADLAIAYVRLRRANRRVNRQGAVVNDSNGVARRNPWLLELHAAQDLVRRLCAEFGLSPSSRTNVSGTKAAAPAAENTPRDAVRKRFFGDAS